MTNEKVRAFSTLGTVLENFNTETQSCSVAAGLSYVITYAEMGYTANP
jgi:hypothetical protein